MRWIVEHVWVEYERGKGSLRVGRKAESGKGSLRVGLHRY